MTDSEEQSPPASASPEIFDILRNTTAHYRNYKSSPLVPILSQINPSHTPNHYQ
jgi:hypothetical protein